MYRVHLERHAVDRWLVPARSCKVPAADGGQACELVARWALADVGAPPWKPYLRHSMRFTKAEPVESQIVTTLNVAHGQLELFGPRLAA